MQLSYLESIPHEWRRVLVIGKTIERDGKKYHIVGISLGETANLYILEPYSDLASPGRNLHRHSKQCAHLSNRARLKQYEERQETYLHCSEIRLGDKILKIQGGTGSPMQFADQDYRSICLFVDMMRAGWNPPDWLKEETWENLQLITLHIEGLKRLPKYSPEMPITLKHRPDHIRHIVEKTVMLTVGKSRSFHFTDYLGDEVQCCINNVTLIDVWEDTERQFDDPKYIKKIPPERLQEVKEACRRALEQNVPKGMCYIGIEYECSKDYQLQFYSKEHLRSYPETRNGSASALLMNLKPDKKTGAHGLPLKGTVINTPVAPDTARIPAEMFMYFEKIGEWEEQV